MSSSAGREDGGRHRGPAERERGGGGTSQLAESAAAIKHVPYIINILESSKWF